MIDEATGSDHLAGPDKNAVHDAAHTLRSTTDMLRLRWRAAQCLMACTLGDGDSARALRALIRDQGFADRDFTDEFRLLLDQFRHRPTAALSVEIQRMRLALTHGIRL